MTALIKIFFITLLFLVYLNQAVASQADVLSSQQHEKWDDVATSTLLENAKSLRFEEPQESVQIATYALTKVKSENNTALTAQIHSLIAWLSHELQNNNDAKYHYLQASRLFTDLNDTEHQITNAFEYIELLFLEDNHNIAYQNLDKLLPIAKSYEDNRYTSLLLMLRANSLYYQKRYHESEAAFLEAIEYLNLPDTATQTNRGEAFHQLGQIFKHLTDYKKSGDYHQLALETHTQLGIPSLVARSLKNVGIAEAKQGNYSASLDYTIRGLRIQETINEPSKRAELLVLAGAIYRQLNRYETSLEYIRDALQMYRELGDMGKIADSLNQMGLLYNRLKKYDEAYELYKEILELPSEKIRLSTIGIVNREISAYKKRQGEYESAMQFAQKAHNIFMQLNDLDKATKTSRIIGDIYHDTGKYEKAIYHFKEALSLAEKTNNLTNKVKITVSLGYAYKFIDLELAKEEFNKALALAKDANLYNDKASIYRELMRIEERNGEYRVAFDHAKKLIAVREIISEQYESNKIAVAKAALDSHITENELASLRERVRFDELAMAKQSDEIEIAQQANQISELELEKNRYANILLIAMLVLCSMFGIYIFRIFILSKRRNVELDYLATHDPLTNCYNRRGFFEIIERDFSNSENATVYSIIMADVDHFKAVNDEYGHEVGDTILKGVADVLEGCIRKNDIVARYGGEEFCIAVADISTDKVQDIAEKMRVKIQDACFENISVSCSFGIATLHNAGDSPTELISKADKALYYSKANGRNQVNVWDISMLNEEIKLKVVSVR